ncbi:MAG: DUF3365 domain-containing protein [Proteobacteria bacterium]|nr:MAG: DUF3365 domain-containing protein [Pseudomonadota bacterium]
MKRFVLSTLAALFAASAAVAQDIDALSAESRAAIKAFGGSLKAELQAAIKAGGPANAIEVCNERAPEIAAEVSGARGLDVARRSLRNRNPLNEPTAWEAAVLERFEARKAAGESVDQIDHAEVVETDGGKVFRYMKAIPTGEVCLKCHGKELAPEVVEQLESLYPEDTAKGFSLGDIRGAFRVVKPL